MSDRDEDRGISPVAGTRKPFVSKRTMTIGLGVMVAGVAVLTVWQTRNPREEPIKEKLPASLGSVVPYSAPQMIVPAPVAMPAPLRYDPPPPRQPDPVPLAMPRRDPVARVVPSVPVAQAQAPKPYMLSFAEPQPVARAPDGAAPGTARLAGGSGPGTPVSSVSYAASHIDGAQAGLFGDQTFLLMPMVMPCTLDTAINSTFEGPIQCHLAMDIKPHGVTLLDRGSIVHGWYRNNIQTGQARLFVQADWVQDPATGCYITFDNAPISDTIGQAGIAGNVDAHLLERFGAAVLLTLGDSGMSLARAAISKGGNTYLNFNSGGGVESIASAILRKQIDIPPTITVHQGEDIAVFVTKPLDFTPCYDLKLKDQ